MTRLRAHFAAYSLRPRLYLLITLLLVSAYVGLRSTDYEDEVIGDYEDDRLAHLGLNHVGSVTHERPDGFPLKGLDVDRWIPGGKKKVLITGGAGQIGA